MIINAGALIKTVISATRNPWRTDPKVIKKLVYKKPENGGPLSIFFFQRDAKNRRYYPCTEIYEKPIYYVVLTDTTRAYKCIGEGLSFTSVKGSTESLNGCKWLAFVISADSVALIDRHWGVKRKTFYRDGIANFAVGDLSSAYRSQANKALSLMTAAIKQQYKNAAERKRPTRKGWRYSL